MTFQELADKFWPLPGWPENWKWEVQQFNRYDLTQLWKRE